MPGFIWPHCYRLRLARNPGVHNLAYTYVITAPKVLSCVGPMICKNVVVNIFSLLLQWDRYRWNPDNLNHMDHVNTLVRLGPMPVMLRDLPNDLGELRNAICINEAQIRYRTAVIWPSNIQPPYSVSEGWLWIWVYEAGGGYDIFTTFTKG